MQKKVLSEIALYYGDVAMPKDWDIDRDKLQKDILQSVIQNKDFPFSRTWDMLNTYMRDHIGAEYGINLVNKEGRLTVDTLKWNGLAKKAGIETEDVITEFKIENLDRPNKAIIYPFSFLLIFIFGYNNYRRKLE